MQEEDKQMKLWKKALSLLLCLVLVLSVLPMAAMASDLPECHT